MSTGTRLTSHLFFPGISIVLIVFRNYSGRSEQERIIHIKTIASINERNSLEIQTKYAYYANAFDK